MDKVRHNKGGRVMKRKYSGILTNPKEVRVLMCGKRKLEPYEKLVSRYRKAELQDMCKDYNIDFNPEATKLDLALILIEHRPNIKT